MKLAITPAQVAFHYAKIIGNFGGEINGTVRYLQRWSSLTGLSGLTETCCSFSKNSHFQPHCQAVIKILVKTQMDRLDSIRTLFQSNGVVAFSLDNSTSFLLFGLAKWKAHVESVTILLGILLRRKECLCC